MAEKALRSLPINLTGETRVLARLDDTLLDATASDPLASVALEKARPIRGFFSWRGKRNYEGVWWSSTTRRHVGFESLLEREFLMAADFDGGVVGVASQPLALLWPRGTEGHKSHVPDYFCRLSDGDGRLVDVRRPDRVDANAKQFDMTRRFSERAGWQYEVFTGLPTPRLQNLRWLSGYRQDRYAPTDDSCAHIVDAFSPGTSLRAGVLRAARTSGVPSEIVQANVLHLLFAQLLRADIDKPLSMETEVSA